jgi:mannitol 2-dehydrogenase
MAAPISIEEELALLRAENARLRAKVPSKDATPVMSPPTSPIMTAAQVPESPRRQRPGTVPLSSDALPMIEASSAADVPPYSRSGVTKWIAHVGLGGFSRSHLAMLTDEVLIRQLATAEPESNGFGKDKWGICAVGLMPWDVKLKDSLQSQDNLYTILSRDSVAGDTARVIGSIMDYIHVPDDPKASLDRLADPSTAILSLTVTEKGYCVDATGSLDLENKLIKHDVAPGGLDAPQSAPGLIAAALKLRRERGIPPFVVLSCDNLPMNGNMAKKATVALLQQVDTDLAEWVASSAVAFPNSMVDRITPVTTDVEKDVLKTEFGIVDAWPVVAEPYVQWVVEDVFNGSVSDGARPAWDLASGVQFVPDVQPYELMKLRLLNSTHSALAYVGYLAGYRLVHDAMDDPLVRGFITRYMAGVAPSIPPVPGVNLTEYQAILIRRFSNARIADKLLRLAQDGSAKWASTLALGGLAHSALGSMQFAGSDLGQDPPLFTKYVRSAEDLMKLQRWRQDHLIWRKKGLKGARGEFGADVSLLQEARAVEPPPADVALALAAWVRYMTGVDEDGISITIEDPLAHKLTPLAKAACTGASYDKVALAQFLSLALGESAASWSELTTSVGRWLVAIRSRGIISALAESLAESSVAPQAGDTGAAGADLSMVPGGSSAQARLAVLKLKQARLKSEMDEVNTLLESIRAEANAEMEKVASQSDGLGRKISFCK